MRLHEQGVAVLVAVLIIGAVASISAITVLFYASSSTSVSRAGQDGYESVSVADGCAELALLQIQGDTAFTGTVNDSVNGNNCTYTVQDLPGGSKQIDASATVLTSTAQVRVIVNQLNPQLAIESWRVL